MGVVPDPDRLEGLAEALDAADAERDDSSEGAAGTSKESDRDDREEHATEGDEHAADHEERSEQANESPPADRTPTSSDPAFAFDDTTPKSVYVRESTLRTIDDVEALVDAQLRTDQDVRNLATREFYDAVFRVAADRSEDVVKRVIAMRESSEG